MTQGHFSILNVPSNGLKYIYIYIYVCVCSLHQLSPQHYEILLCYLLCGALSMFFVQESSRELQSAPPRVQRSPAMASPWCAPLVLCIWPKKGLLYLEKHVVRRVQCQGKTSLRGTPKKNANLSLIWTKTLTNTITTQVAKGNAVATVQT